MSQRRWPAGGAAPADPVRPADPERRLWDDRYRSGDHRVPAEADPLVRDVADGLPPGSLALDLACGPGRNALHLARQGHRVVAVDLSQVALERLSDEARREELPVMPVQADLARFTVPPASFDLVVDVHFLERALFPVIRRALRPGGRLVFTTFTTREIDGFGRDLPRRLLLEPGELRRAFADLDVLRYEEDVFRRCGGRRRAMARLIARATGTDRGVGSG